MSEIIKDSSADIEEIILLEKALTKIINHIKHHNVSLSKSFSDGRVNSAKNEEEIIECIKDFEENNDWMKKHNLKLGTPNINNNNNREWYDFSIESIDTTIHNYFMPINIKVSQLDGGAADNLNCKLGIFWALTGCLPSSVMVNKKPLGNGVSWDKFFEKVDEKMAINKTKDYYFLVVNKENAKDVFWTSLKKLNCITPNGSNLPFQCKWKDNRVKVERNYYEARDFVLSCFKDSIQKREIIGTAFKKHIDKYIGLKTDRLPQEAAASEAEGGE